MKEKIENLFLHCRFYDCKRTKTFAALTFLCQDVKKRQKSKKELKNLSDKEMIFLKRQFSFKVQ